MNENETKQNALNILYEIIEYIDKDIKSSKHAGLSDVSKIHEYTIMHLLNILFGYKLYNTNDIKNNFPAIDLADDENKLAYQITYNTDKGKPIDTITKFLNNKATEQYRKYKLIIFYLTEKPEFNEDEITYFKQQLQNNFEMQDIFQLNEYANKINLSDANILIKLLNFLEIRTSTLFELEIYKYQINVFSNMQDFTNKKFNKYSSKFIEFINSNDKKILYISGDGGVGKSHLTIYLLTKHSKDIPYIPVFINPVTSDVEKYDKFKNTSLKWLFICDDIKRFSKEQIKAIITSGLDEKIKIVISSRITEKEEHINFIDDTYSAYINKYTEIKIAWNSREEIYDFIKDYFNYTNKELPEDIIINKYIDKFASNPFLLIHGISNNYKNIKDYARKLSTEIKNKLSIENKQDGINILFKIALNVPFGLNNDKDLKNYIYKLKNDIIEINNNRYTFIHDIIGDLILIETINNVDYSILEDELKNQPYNKLINIRQAYSYNKFLNLDEAKEKLIKLDAVDDIIFNAFNSNDKNYSNLKSNDMIKLYKYMIEELPKTNFYLFTNNKINNDDINYYVNRLISINFFQYLNDNNYILFLENIYAAHHTYYSFYHFMHLKLKFNRNIANIIISFYEKHEKDANKEKFNKIFNNIFSNIFVPKIFYKDILSKKIFMTHIDYKCNELKEFFKWAIPKFMKILINDYNLYYLWELVEIYNIVNDESKNLFKFIINEINKYFINVLKIKNFENTYSIEMPLLRGRLKKEYKVFYKFLKHIYNNYEYLLFRISKRYFMPQIPITDDSICNYIQDFKFVEYDNISDRIPNLNNFINKIALNMDVEQLVKIFCYIDIIHVNTNIFFDILDKRNDLVENLLKKQNNIKNFIIISHLYTIKFRNKTISYNNIESIEDYFGIVNNQINKNNKNINKNIIIQYLNKIDIFDTLNKKHAAFCKLYENTEYYYKENNILENFIPILDIFIKYINNNGLLSKDTLYMIYSTFIDLKHLKEDLTDFNKNDLLILLSNFAKRDDIFYFKEIKKLYNIFNFNDEHLLLFISYLNINFDNIHSNFIGYELKYYINSEKAFNSIVNYMFNLYQINEYKYDYLYIHNVFLDDTSLFKSYIYNALNNAKTNNEEDKFIFLMKLFSTNDFDNSIQINFIEYAFNILKNNNQMYLLISIVNVDGSTDYDRYKSLYNIIKNSKNKRLKNYINKMIDYEANILKEYNNSSTSEEENVLRYQEPHTEPNHE